MALTGAARFASGSVIVRPMLDPHREIYRDAPLKLVAFEIRYSPIPRLESDSWEAVYESLREDLPILGPRPQMELKLTPTGAEQVHRGHRLMNRNRTCSAILMNESAALETSSYERFEEWSALIQSLLQALDGAAPIPSVQRLGLRYIDEIHVDGFESATPADWSRYIAQDLLAPAAHYSDLTASNYRATIHLHASDHEAVKLGFGVFADPVVDPHGPLRIKESPHGEYFLMDLDSSWSAPEGEFPAFDLETVMQQIESLHLPIREIFEASITEELRQEMRGGTDG